MPRSTRGKKRDQLVCVQVNESFGYVFATRDLSSEAGISDSELKNALGHMETAQAAQISGIVMVSGANAPKPPRVRKSTGSTAVNQSATVETFCGFNRITQANSAGFKLSKRAVSVSLAAPRSNRRQFSGVVTLSNGLKYVQSLDSIAATADRRTTLGIEIASQISALEGKKLARGCRTKPGRVEVSLEGGLSARLPFSTDKQQEAGALGSILQSEYVEYI